MSTLNRKCSRSSFLVGNVVGHSGQEKGIARGKLKTGLAVIVITPCWPLPDEALH